MSILHLHPTCLRPVIYRGSHSCPFPDGEMNGTHNPSTGGSRRHVAGFWRMTSFENYIRASLQLSQPLLLRHRPLSSRLTHSWSPFPPCAGIPCPTWHIANLKVINVMVVPSYSQTELRCSSLSHRDSCRRSDFRKLNDLTGLCRHCTSPKLD